MAESCADKSNIPKYKQRNSPPRSANELGCQGKTFVGNDGNMYRSEKRGMSKTYRWYKISAASRPAPTGRVAGYLNKFAVVKPSGAIGQIGAWKATGYNNHSASISKPVFKPAVVPSSIPKPTNPCGLKASTKRCAKGVTTDTHMCEMGTKGRCVKSSSASKPKVVTKTTNVSKPKTHTETVKVSNTRKPAGAKPTATRKSRKPCSKDSLDDCRVIDLKTMLREAGLKLSGRKAELIERLRSAFDTVPAPTIVKPSTEFVEPKPIIKPLKLSPRAPAADVKPRARFSPKPVAEKRHIAIDRKVIQRPAVDETVEPSRPIIRRSPPKVTRPSPVIEIDMADKPNLSIDQVMRYKELRPREVNSNPEKYLSKYVGWYMSEKIDGWHAIWDGTTLHTKSFAKTFNVPSWFVSLLRRAGVPAMTGEIKIEGMPASKTAKLTSKKGIASEWGTAAEPKAFFHVFDIVDSKHVRKPFKERVKIMQAAVHLACAKVPHCPILLSTQRPISSVGDILEYWGQVTSRGGEGLVLTNPTSFYQASKTKSSDRVKLKTRNDAEGLVTGDFTMGYGGDMSLLKSMTIEYNGKTFQLGIGFTNDQRRNFAKLFRKGMLVTFSYEIMLASGLPRHARFLRVRDEATMHSHR